MIDMTGCAWRAVCGIFGRVCGGQHDKYGRGVWRAA